MIDQLIQELTDKLPVDGHPGGPGYEGWMWLRERLIREYMEKAFEEGRDLGREENY